MKHTGKIFVVMLSALLAMQSGAAVPSAAAVEASRTHASHIKTSQLNNLITQIREGGHTVTDKGRRLKIHYVTQTGERPPAFTFWCNAPDLVDDNYERFLENRLRETFDLVGTPIRLKFRRKDD